MKKIGNLVAAHIFKDRPKNLSREFQFYGCELCEDLGDTKHYSLYIKLAKDIDRVILEQARSFVKDYPNAKSKPKLFMWKVKQLKTERASKVPQQAAEL